MIALDKQAHFWAGLAIMLGVSLFSDVQAQDLINILIYNRLDGLEFKEYIYEPIRHPS